MTDVKTVRTKSPSFINAYKKLTQSILKKHKPIPFYLKKEMPDHRFLDFRLFIHNRKVNEVQHDLKYFEPMLNSYYSKKTSKSASSYKKSNVFNAKKQEYIEKFTNGKVNIETFIEKEESSSLKKYFNKLRPSISRRLNSFVDKAQAKKRKKLEESLKRPNTSKNANITSHTPTSSKITTHKRLRSS
jgi:hypothetical protein